MQNDRLLQGGRRAARMRWWGQVLAYPDLVTWNELVDEMVRLRFSPVEAESPSARLDRTPLRTLAVHFQQH